MKCWRNSPRVSKFWTAKNNPPLNESALGAHSEFESMFRMARRRFKMTTAIRALVLTMALSLPNSIMAGVPTDQLRMTVDRVLAILNDPKLNAPSAKEARRAELRKTIFPRFDFEEMAKRSLGSEWRRRTPAEQKKFVDLFTELLKNSYVESIESYRGEKVLYRRESQDGDYA